MAIAEAGSDISFAWSGSAGTLLCWVLLASLVLVGWAGLFS